MLFDRPRGVFAQSLDAIGESFILRNLLFCHLNIMIPSCMKAHSLFHWYRADICFEVQHSLMAIHTRIGAGSITSSSSKRDDTDGFFLPRTTVEEDASIVECPFWTLIARSLGTTIEFIALPGGTSVEQDVSDGFYLRADLMIPEDSEVTNIAFYGDDGKSSLSPNANEDSAIKEGRQSVGFVVKCQDSLSQEVSEELWVFRYDDILFRKFDFKRNLKSEVTISATEFNENECTVLAMSDEESGDSSVIVPKSELLMSVNAQFRLCIS